MIRLYYVHVLTVGILVFYFVDGPHAVYREDVSKQAYFAGYWILLGIASSVGLGTGLHTFVLYLGPFIAKVTMASNECNMTPKYDFDTQTFEQCEKFEGENTITILDIYWAVALESFLWGMGTAIGELPPYFVSRAAAQAGRKHEELEEMESEMNSTFIGRQKANLYYYLKKNAFLVVLICASIPNPLFDLAGLTCGHFMIPFMTFFGATFIGKACFKVSI